ncbi:hypothetical protein HDU77_005838 [Chytriomyces hyalinus]|nr:hypothetical protein HDU77_005838 [Chytriomyces hyalinus]
MTSKNARILNQFKKNIFANLILNSFPKITAIPMLSITRLATRRAPVKTGNRFKSLSTPWTPTRLVNTPSRQLAQGFSSTTAASNDLPLKTLRDILVLSKDVKGGDPATGTEKKPTTAADFLTLMSQIILVGSTGLLLYCAVFPNQMSNLLENYKEQLTQRRHDRIVEFMTSERPYLSGNVEHVSKGNEGNEEGVSEVDSATQSLMFHNQIYHTDVADDIKKILLQPPVLRYGIITGPTGSGKSRLIRTLVKEETHYAVLSMGLISGVKSLVDALSEEIGYDFDDWTERMLQGYLFNGSTVSFPTQLDKLAFLLDEFEEACWSLKFNPKSSTNANTTTTTTKRPVLVLDDIDLLDTSDKDTRQAVRMLFNCANKWAREDTALVVFTTGNASLMDETGEIAKIVRPEVLELAKVYNVGCLTPESADRFLRDRIGSYGGFQNLASALDTGDLERKKVQWVVGTKMFDLIKVCDELVKKDTTVDQVLHSQLSEAIADVRRAFDDVGNVVGERQLRTLCLWMDSIAQIPVSEAASKGHLFEEARRKGFGDAMKFLLGRDIVSSNGLFSSDLIRNAYCKYRSIPIAYTPSAEAKKPREIAPVAQLKQHLKRSQTSMQDQRNEASAESNTSTDWPATARDDASGAASGAGVMGWSWIGVSTASAQGVEWERISGTGGESEGKESEFEKETDTRRDRDLEGGPPIHPNQHVPSHTTDDTDSLLHQMTPSPTIHMTQPQHESGSPSAPEHHLPISIASSIHDSHSVSGAASAAESEALSLSLSLSDDYSNADLNSPCLGHASAPSSDKGQLETTAAQSDPSLSVEFMVQLQREILVDPLHLDMSSESSSSRSNSETQNKEKEDASGSKKGEPQTVKSKKSCVKVKIPEKHRASPVKLQETRSTSVSNEIQSSTNSSVSTPPKANEDEGKKEDSDWIWRLLVIGGKLAIASISIVVLSKFVR